MAISDVNALTFIGMVIAGLLITVGSMWGTVELFCVIRDAIRR